jgi:ribose/xylose/arabinose/galactoside ABC-type transport system permease subunit
MTWFNRRTAAPIVLLVVGALLAYFLVPRFGTGINIGYFLLQSVPLLLTAVGQTLVIITAGIDLSVGACVTLAGVVASLLMDPVNGGSVPLALAACLGAAVLVGLVNGLLIVRFNLPPFLATLGMTFFLAGINLYLRPVPGGHIARSFQDAATTRWAYIPATSVVTLVLLSLIAFLYRQVALRAAAARCGVE